MSYEKTLAKAEVFQRIQYSQCWEDPLLHKEAFNLRPGQTILAVAAAGDNVFAHLLDDPSKVMASDFNPTQIALIHLKMAAIRNLSWKACIEFLGERPGNDRWEVYQVIRKDLDREAVVYWDSKKAEINKGVIHAGHFEAYLRTFRKWVLPLVHSKDVCQRVFDPKAIDKQHEFYDKVWDNWRGRLLFRMFFSRFVLSRFGRSREQFLHVEKKNISEQFLDRAKLVLRELPAYQNPFLQYILLGRHPYLEYLHPYLQEQNYQIIKERLDRIELHTTSIGEALENVRDQSIDAFNLSDIFEYIDFDTFTNLGVALHRVAAKGAVFSYWDFLVPRRLSASLPGMYEYNPALSRKLWMQDRAFVYGDYVVDYAKVV